MLREHALIHGIQLRYTTIATVSTSCLDLPCLVWDGVPKIPYMDPKEGDQNVPCFNSRVGCKNGSYRCLHKHFDVQLSPRNIGKKISNFNQMIIAKKSRESCDGKCTNACSPIRYSRLTSYGMNNQATSALYSWCSTKPFIYKSTYPKSMKKKMQLGRKRLKKYSFFSYRINLTWLSYKKFEKKLTPSNQMRTWHLHICSSFNNLFPYFNQRMGGHQ